MTPYARIRNKCDKLWFQKNLKLICELCGKKAVQVHHFYPKGLYGHLRYVDANGISLCSGCHSRIHFQDPELADKIIKKKGANWYHTLRAMALEPPEDYKLSAKWYKSQYDILTRNKKAQKNR